VDTRRRVELQTQVVRATAMQAVRHGGSPLVTARALELLADVEEWANGDPNVERLVADARETVQAGRAVHAGASGSEAPLQGDLLREVWW
jgi:hypothetical protein